MKRLFTIFLLVIFFSSVVSAQNGIAGIRPNHITREEMLQDILALYNDYKDRHLKNTPSGNYYIYLRMWSGTNITHSCHAHGLGMIIFAQMANYDPDARKIFDGMNQLRKAQPSRINSNLMSRVVFEEYINNINPEETPANVSNSGTGRNNSVTIGDLDMAYALLLAYRQWGDSAYKNEATTIINALKESSISQSSKRVRFTDGARDSLRELDTYSSDWTPGHFRAFATITGDDFWLETADTVYSLLKQVSHSETGLMPSLITGIPPRPYSPGGSFASTPFLEFSDIAAPVLWRLALDYAFHATPDAKYSINKISNWLRGATGGDINSIYSGYFLDGRRFHIHFQTHLSEFSDVTLVAPFASGMIADPNNQEFLNRAYDRIRNAGDYDSYRAAMQILNMLLITGNWIDPVAENQIIPTSISNIKKSDRRHGIRFAQNIVSEKAEISVILPNNETARETKIAIYDMTGNAVFVETTAPGRPLTWNLTNTAGRFVANGTYLVIAEVKGASGKVYAYSAQLGVKK